MRPVHASRAARRLESAQWGCFGAVAGALTAVTVGRGPAWLAVVAFAADMISALSFLRALRLALRVDVAGIEVRNLWKTSRVGWDEIETIGWAETPVIASQYSSIWRPAVAFLRKPGRVLTAEATFALAPAEREALVADLAEHARLNSIPIAVAPEDLRSYWFRRRLDGPNPALSSRGRRRAPVREGQ